MPYEVSVRGETGVDCDHNVAGCVLLERRLQFTLGYLDPELNQVIYHRGRGRSATSKWFALDIVLELPTTRLVQTHARHALILLHRQARQAAALRGSLAARHIFVVRSQVVMLFKFTSFVVVLLHWVACGWVLIAQVEGDSGHPCG